MSIERPWAERQDEMLAQVFGFKPRHAAVPVATPTHQILTLDLGGAVTMNFVLIQPGTFMMGSPDNERGRNQDEGPQHQVTISKPFYMGRYQVTQSQWQEMMRTDPSVFKGYSSPVENISWRDCQGFFRRLSAQIGKRVRLPTEAEWEYACRAGTVTPFCSGDSESSLQPFAWHYGDNVGKESPVGQKKPNPWGLYDTHGNVCEWCDDWYDIEYYGNSPRMDPRGPDEGFGRVLRGGAWNYISQYCRSANRNSSPPYNCSRFYGFRCVLEA